MSRKNTLVTQLSSVVGASPPTVFSLSSSFTTPPTVVRYLDNCSYQINVTTTNSVGTFAVQVSDDYQANELAPDSVINPGNWSNLSLSGTPSVASANDVINISLNQLPFYAVRLAYTSGTAGTGTCAIFITDKQIGG